MLGLGAIFFWEIGDEFLFLINFYSMKSQKRYSETLSNRYIEKKLMNLSVNQEDAGSHDSISTCEDINCENIPDRSALPRSKLKVELCRNYLENRQCPYKSRCKFAHGLEELLKNEDLGQNFRTKKCKIFYDKKHCRFGERCNFRHLGPLNEEKKSLFTLHILSNYRQIVQAHQSGSRILKNPNH